MVEALQLEIELIDELREKVISLLKEKWTSNQIARELGITRNAVCGLRHRYNMKHNEKIGNTGRRKKTLKRPKEKKRWSKATPPMVFVDNVKVFVVGKKIHRLKEHECKYAVTSHNCPPSDHRFCGKPQKENSPYCEEHHKLCRETTNDRKKLEGTNTRGPMRLAERFHFNY